MDRRISDEQVDKIAKNLLQDFVLDDETIDEIADSPKLWWNVKNQIEMEKTRRERNWFVAFRPQILAFGALAMVICFGLAALFLNFKDDSQPVARENSVQTPTEEKVKIPENPAVVAPKDDFKNPEISKKSGSNPVPAKVPAKTVEPKTKFIAKNQLSETSAKQTNNSPKVLAKKAEETKTDFIALSYAANTDSGQIVRVKVPSAMMVSLGVATDVEKESKLVSAEVIIGDDGLARAIRFIR
ncbi:MAG TPA: hypothetical protein VNB22_17870 [Pyrinomonadaceae bacterium]|jgi:hypothetical protein|nr:hypothetical protein [Pyrinomonadaceae bacterium]